jgi:hypothetical protein
MLLAAGLLLGLAAAPAHAANLVVDPGFETCASVTQSPLPGWSVSSSHVFCDITPHAGYWDATFQGTGGTLSQAVSTVTGDVYDFSFYLRDLASGSDSFTASFGTSNVLNLVNTAAFGYTLENFTVTATNSIQLLQFTGAATSGVWALDDVSVVDMGPATPEPTSLMLFAGGLVAILRLRRKWMR